MPKSWRYFLILALTLTLGPSLPAAAAGIDAYTMAASADPVTGWLESGATAQVVSIDDSSVWWDDPAPTVEVGIIVLYTAEEAASVDDITTTVEETIAMVNRVFKWSNTGVVLNLVHSGLVDYPDDNGIDQSWWDLTTRGDGKLEEVWDLRETYGGDLVSLWVSQADDNAGMGTILTWEEWDARPPLPEWTGMTVLAGDYVTRSDLQVLAHELGHNFGLDHDAYTLEKYADEMWGVKPYGRGYVDVDAGFQTTMAYEDQLLDAGYTYKEIRVLPFFSNPELHYLGRPVGDPDFADGARVIRETAPVIAARY